MAEKIGSFQGLELEYYCAQHPLKSIKSEEDLFKLLEDLLFRFNDERDVFPVDDDLGFSGDVGDKNFKVNSKILGDLMPPLSKKFPIQLIQSHVAKDAIYNFNYSNSDLPLDIEYKLFNDLKIIQSIKQKKRTINLEGNGAGETSDTKVILSYLDKKEKINNRFVANMVLAGFCDWSEGHDKETIDQLKKLSKIWYPYILEVLEG